MRTLSLGVFLALLLAAPGTASAEEAVASAPPPVVNERALFTAEDLLKEMDEAGVSGAILHPPRAWAPTRNKVPACLPPRSAARCFPFPTRPDWSISRRR